MTKKSNTKEFIMRAVEVHGDKWDYSLVDYKGPDLLEKGNTEILTVNPTEFLEKYLISKDSR